MGIGAALVTFFAKASFISVGFAKFIVGVLQLIAVVGISKLLQKTPEKPNLDGRTLTSKSTTSPQAKIYGEVLIAGTLAYLDALGTDARDLWAVHVFAGHEVDSISDVWLDEITIPDADIGGGASAGGVVTGNTKYRNSRNSVTLRLNPVEIYKHYGTAAQTVNSQLSTAAGLAWGSSHRLRGHAYIVTKFSYFDELEKLWEAGEPTNVKALVKGAKVYDPRLDSTFPSGSGSHRDDDSSTWAWSDNPALCVADFLRDSKFSPLAGGIAASRIDYQSVFDAADDCDVLVVVPPAASPENTQKRYTCNGVIYGTSTPEDGIADLLSSMMGELIFSADKYFIRAGVYESPVDTLDEDDIVGPVVIGSALDSEERINTCKAEYIDKAMLYEATETVAISIASYKDTRDGGDELIKNISLSMTDTNFMAQRICIKTLTLGNEEMTLSVPCNLRAARFVAGDRINVEITELAWTPKIFRVLGWTLFDSGGSQVGVKLELREDSSGAHNDPAVSDYNTKTIAGVLVLADPIAIPSVDSIPMGINYGGALWDIRIAKNQDGNEDALLGGIFFSLGEFLLPDGTLRVISAPAAVNTPYEFNTYPPDFTFYIVWGATSADTRFSQTVSPSPEADDDWGDATATAAGIFTAIYDRTRNKWYAVGNTGNEYEFTPIDSDYVVARGRKFDQTVASPDVRGIDELIAVTQFINDPLATQPGQSPSASNLVYNGGMDIRRPFTGLVEGVFRPFAWFNPVSTTANQIPYYLNGDPNTGVLVMPRTIVSGQIFANPRRQYRVLIRLKASQTMNASLDLRIGELDTNMDFAGGKEAVGAGTGEAEVENRTRLITLLSNQNITTSYQVFEAIYTPTSTVRHFSVDIFDSDVTGDFHIDWVSVDGEVGVQVTAAPQTITWDTFEAGGWSPADTTLEIIVVWSREGTEIARLTLRGTLDISGADEGDIIVSEISSSGEATTSAINNNDTKAVNIDCSHDDTGVGMNVQFLSAVPGYSGGPSK